MATAGATVATKVIQIDVIQSANAQAAVKSMADSMRKVEKSADDMKKKVEKAFDFKGVMQRGLAFGVGTAGAFGFATSFADLAAAVLKAADAYSILGERMALVVGAGEASRRAIDDTIAISVASGQAVDGVAKLYEKTARAAQRFGITQDDARKITEGFSQSLRLSGASTQEAQAALIQFGQALASGRLQGDEFRSLMENNSFFMEQLAAAAGKTTSELRALGTEGKLGPQFLLDTLLKAGVDGVSALDRIAQAAAKVPLTLQQQFNGLMTTLGAATGEMVKFFTTAKSGLSGIELMSKELDLQRKRLRDLGEEMDAVRAGPLDRLLAAYGLYLDFLKESFGFRGTDRQDRIGENLDDLIKKRDRLDAVVNPKGGGLFNRMRQVNAEQQKELDGLNKKIRALKAIQDIEQNGAMYNAMNAKDANVLAGRNRLPAEEEKKPKGGGAKGDSPLLSYYKNQSRDLLIAKKEYDLAVAAAAAGSKPDEVDVLQKFEAMLKSGDIKVGKGEEGLLKQTRETLAALVEVNKEQDRLKKHLEQSKKSVETMQKLGEEAAAAASASPIGIIDKIKADANGVPSVVADLEALQQALRGELRDNGDLSGGQRAALEDRLAKISDQLYGVSKPIDDVKDKVQSLTDVFNDNLANAVQNAADSFVEFALEGKGSFTDLINNMLKDLTRLMVSDAFAVLFKGQGQGGNNLGLIGNLIASFFGGNTNTPQQNFRQSEIIAMNTSANGNIMTDRGPLRLQQYANGGIARGPMMSIFGEGRRPEAYVPLNDGRTIPVSLKDSAGLGGGNVQVNIYNEASDSEVTTQNRQDGNGNTQLDVFITKKVREVVNTDVNRGEGVARTLEGKYGLSRV